ncbi:hypothetical protein D3C71_1367910 [compost metagenome]
MPETAAMPFSRRFSTISRFSSAITTLMSSAINCFVMRRPTSPCPTITTWSRKYSCETSSGSIANGSPLRSSKRARCERSRIQRCTGSIAENTKLFKVIEMSAPAKIRFCPSKDKSLSETPSVAKMKENSPICASEAPTVRAVLMG